MDYEIYHSGVKGMKWGVRRYQNKDGSLTAAGKNRYRNADGSLNDKGVKKYAKKGYAQDSFNSNKTVAGKAWDAYTGAHKIHASAKYETSSKKQNRERAEQYLREREEKRANKSDTRKKAAKVVAKGAAATATAASKIGMAYVTDQVFYNGVGTKVAKETVKAMGMATITAYTMARGGYDIKWYDKQGNRVG
jgi:hypothetical protein